MANKVFANGREIACKAADGKSICAFPDVCFTPPQTPATPPGVPIPYPNTAYAKDTTKGSKTVKISNQEVMLKNKSHFKKSTGNEAGRAPKKGIVTSRIQGKVYFTSWSPNVKFEGKNVVRHLDLTTHNHGSDPGQTPSQSYIDSSTSNSLEEQLKCECCGQNVHSQAQEQGKYLSEDEFYGTATNQNSSALLASIRNGDCKDILPNPDKPECNRYYITNPEEKKKIEKTWDRHKKRHNLAGKWAHKVPKAAGGCPTRDNVAPVTPHCEHFENQIKQLQDKRLLELGWRTHR